MIKAYEKCKKIVEKEGHFKQYIRALAELETFINDVSFKLYLLNMVSYFY
jgi:hypothetical protein